MYAEVILPLPLYGTYTYAVPDDMTQQIRVGARVLVPFGKKKTYTGLVESTHNNAPAGYDIKSILVLLDEAPIINYPQLNHWKWIADYYLCSIGDVFKAALPTGLKPESETYVTLNDDFEAPEGFKMTERQAEIIGILQQSGRKRISELENATGHKNITAVISRMLDASIINIDEKIVQKYTPKKLTYVELNAERGDNDTLHKYFDIVNGNPRREKLLITYLDRSKWLQPNAALIPITRNEILDETGLTPAILKGMVDKNIMRVVKRSINRFNIDCGSTEPLLSPLSEEQKKVEKELYTLWEDKQVNLLHGVTGSGKTEIYTHIMAQTLAEKNQVLYLVPEISLTTQLTDRLRKVFGNRLLVYHSKFSDNERVDIWKKLLHSTEPMIVLGARSSVFLPFHKLGLVVIDEEHEASFKQYDPAPRYNARDAAIVLATMHNAKVLLGSATPAIESYYKALTGKYGLVNLNNRFEGSVLPEVEIVDMRRQRKQKRNKGVISEPLYLAIESALKDGKQAIMFQNRRGFAPVVICKDCGWSPKCINCDVSMVYHKKSNELKCHYCGYTQPLPSVCPACGNNGIEIFGYGTERIAEEMHQVFKGYRVARMDLDTTRNKDAHQEIIEEFASQDTDILVGTQMVSKGLDFANVKIVGVINADTLLNFPDFRSNERAFNMLEQVSGRAGRRAERGKVIIQTTQPESDVLKYISSHDYQNYYNTEIADRERYAYPPFTRIINVFLKNKDAATVDRAAVLLTKQLQSVFGERVLGPEKPFVSRVALWYLQSIMLKIETGASMQKVKNLLRMIYTQLASHPDFKSTQIYYDVDPV